MWLGRMVVAVVAVALLVPAMVEADSCETNCFDDDREDLYYCQNPNLCLKRRYEQKEHCESAPLSGDGCTDTSLPDSNELDYTDYDGYAITSGSAGWYCVVNGNVTYCGGSKCANGTHCVYFNGTACACVTWGTGTPHNGLIHCLW